MQAVATDQAPVVSSACPIPPAYRTATDIVVHFPRPLVATSFAYRVDDSNGYWTYPASTAQTVVLTLPDQSGTDINVNALPVTADGSVRACAPSVSYVKEGEPLGDAVPHATLDPVSHTSDPLTCAEPFVYAKVAQAAVPVVSSAARLQNITGTARVLVTIGVDGRALATQIIRTPSVLVNESATQAARLSSYTPAIFRCRPTLSEYAIGIVFGSP